MNHYRVQSIELLGLFAALVSFVVSSVQFISGSGLEYFLLGDVVIAFWGDELTVVTDDAVTRLDKVAIAEKNRLQASGMTSKDARKAVIPLLQKHRSKMNTHGGYL